MLSDYPYGFRILGPCTGERRLVDWCAAFNAYAACDDHAKVDQEAYLSAFTFGLDFKDYLARTGSTKDYKGSCWAPWLWWDIDRDGAAGGLEAARRDAGTLIVNLRERFAVDDEAMLLFFSGSKGFHVGLTTAGWSPEPRPLFHRVTRRFCEGFAASVDVAIDSGVYDQVRAFRAPNSRHGKTGRHKRRLTVDELLRLDAAAILRLAEKPAPFEVPDAGGCSFELPAAWNEAADQVRQEAEASEQRRAAVANGDGTPHLNQITMEFIRQGADNGDRHRLLYSAARNLGEFGCPPALAHALLGESALDSGLPPSEVRRQIECGLSDAGKAGAP